MYHRIFDIENRLDEAMFLFGGRQVGKSTLLKERFPNAVYIDLLNSELRNRFQQHPEELRESLLRYPESTRPVGRSPLADGKQGPFLCP